jgi:hypothetical protein
LGIFVPNRRLLLATITGAKTLAASDQPDQFCAGTTYTVGLPAVSGNAGLWFRLTKTTTAATGVVTIDGSGAETINGLASIKLVVQFDAVTLFCDVTAWFIVHDDRKPHMAAMRNTTAQSLTNNTETAAVWNNTPWDNAAIADLTNERFNIKNAGRYLAVASLGVSSGLTAGSSQLWVGLTVNGVDTVSRYIAQVSGSTGWAVLTLGVLNLASGDVVSCEHFQSSGGSRNTGETPDYYEPQIELAMLENLG